jgi:NAD(P)-dependent dehydrogenase (short-subunit alcohol dehydrogenase family)
MSFEGKRVLVTGGTRGIGRAAVEAFLAAGARVAVNGKSQSSTDEAIAELGAGDRAIAAPGDIGAVEGCRKVVAAAVDGLGGLDVLVNNAGAGKVASVEKTEEELWDRLLNINLKGAFFCTKFALPALRASKGNVVNVASIFGIRGNGRGSAAYSASKGGLINLTRELAVELGPDVRVNCLCPGAVDTDMLQTIGRYVGLGDVEAGYNVMARATPLKRVAQPSEIANVILFLASDLASFVTGSVYLADGGSHAGIPEGGRSDG